MSSIGSQHIPSNELSPRKQLSPFKSRRDVISVKESVRLLRVSIDAIRNENVVSNKDNILGELMNNIINHAEKQMKPGINDSPMRLHNITLEYGREGLCELLINLFHDHNLCTCISNSTNIILTTASRLMILLCTNCNENKAKFRQASLVEYYEQLIKLLNASDRIGNKNTVDICSNALFTLLPKSQPRLKEGPEEESIAPLYRLQDGTYQVGHPQESVVLPPHVKERFDMLKNALHTPSASTRMVSEHAILMSNELISPLGATGASTSKLLIRPLPSRGAIQHSKIPPPLSMATISQSHQVFHEITSFTTDEGAGNELKSLNLWLNTLTTIEQVEQALSLVEAKPFPTNIQLATNLFHRLSKLVLLDHSLSDLVRHKLLLPRITKLGKQFVDVADCTVRTCQLLSNLSLNDFVAHELGKCNGCELLAAILFRYGKNSKKITVFCCNAVYNLSYKNENNKIKLRNNGISEAIVTVFRSQVRKYEAEEWATKAAIAVTYGCDENRKEFGLHGVDSASNGYFQSKLRGKKKEEEEKMMEEKRVEDIQYALGRQELLVNLLQVAVLGLKTISHASVNNAVELTKVNAIEVVLLILRYFHGIHTRSNRGIVNNFYYKGVLHALPAGLVGATVSKEVTYDIVLSCVHTLRYILSHDAKTLRVARKQVMALDGGDLLLDVLACGTYRAQHPIILFTVWTVANMCAIPKRLKKLKFKEDRTLKEDLMMGQIQYNSKSADDDQSVGSESIGTTTTSGLGVDSSSTSILNIRSILGELNVCEILQKLLRAYSLKLQKILETKKDLNFLGICLDILRRLLAALQGVVQKCRANKKRLHDLQVVDSLHMLCGLCYVDGYNPNVIVQSFNPLFPAKEWVQLLTKTARRIRYVCKEEEDDDDDDLSHAD